MKICRGREAFQKHKWHVPQSHWLSKESGNRSAFVLWTSSPALKKQSKCHYNSVFTLVNSFLFGEGIASCLFLPANLHTRSSIWRDFPELLTIFKCVNLNLDPALKALLTSLNAGIFCHLRFFQTSSWRPGRMPWGHWIFPRSRVVPHMALICFVSKSTKSLF